MILAGVGILAVLAVVAIIFGRQSRERQVQITVWGVFDEPDAYQEIFKNFRKETGIKASFVKKNVDAYEEEFVNALAAGAGPDVLMMNNAWLPKHYDKLAQAPSGLVSPNAVRETYPQVVSDDLVSGQNVWALPLSVDTLALYYNRDLFDQAGITFPPKTWEELITMVPKLVKVDGEGIIQQAAIAMGGAARNINRASDILAALMLQTGTSIVDRQNVRAIFHQDPGAGKLSAGAEALTFYLQFADPSKEKGVYTWNSDQHYSIDAFSEGTLAMMLNYSFQIPVVRQKGAFVNFSIAPLPQPADASERVDYANYWGYAVAKRSRHASAAWKLIVYMTDYPSAKLYLQKTERPPARRDLIRETIDRPTVGVFARQAMTARTWFQPDAKEIETIFNGMIESVRSGSISVDEAVRRAVNQIDLLLAKFK